MVSQSLRRYVWNTIPVGREHRKIVFFFDFILPVAWLLLSAPLGAQTAGPFPQRVPPKRARQIESGFGVNVDLPRSPYLPWNRRWWTQIFDGGFKWVRLGQYEDGSDQTSWDWVERQRGVYGISPRVDEYVDSLVDNGVNIELQLLYGNPLYTSPAGLLPMTILPEPGTFHNVDRSLYSIFWPPVTSYQISAFENYVHWMVRHFRGRIEYYELWNEENGGYWNPRANPRQYGRLLKSFVKTVHDTDPKAKVIYGGQVEVSRAFARAVLNTCGCASGIDVFAYHTYPGDRHENLNPEAMDSAGPGGDSALALREMVRAYPGIRPDIQFWDNEFNAPPAWVRGMSESVQTKYVPRGIIYNWASGVRTFIWELINDTSDDEGDDRGLIHGMMHMPADFHPRPVFYSVRYTNALFSDTHRDATIKIEAPGISQAPQDMRHPFFAYGFRRQDGKTIVAFWLGVISRPGRSVVIATPLILKNTGIRNPVLIDIDTGKITPLKWEEGTTDTLKGVFVSDQVQAVADKSYVDWPVLPATPSSLNVRVDRSGLRLGWQNHGKNYSYVLVERRTGQAQPWRRIAKLPEPDHQYLDSQVSADRLVSYRVQALNGAGRSGYSNIVDVVH